MGGLGLRLVVGQAQARKLDGLTGGELDLTALGHRGDAILGAPRLAGRSGGGRRRPVLRKNRSRREAARDRHSHKPSPHPAGLARFAPQAHTIPIRIGPSSDVVLISRIDRV
jgi:hypothetical protein